MRVCGDCGKEISGNGNKKYCAECRHKRAAIQTKISREKLFQNPMIVTCRFCGKEYEKRKYNEDCCEKCKAEKPRFNKRKTNTRPTMRNTSLVRDAVEAKKLGLSYGQYSAMRAMGKI